MLAGARFYADNLIEHQPGEAPILTATKKWLDQYFKGQKPTFTPLLRPSGTPFHL